MLLPAPQSQVWAEPIHDTPPSLARNLLYARSPHTAVLTRAFTSVCSLPPPPPDNQEGPQHSEGMQALNTNTSLHP